MRRPEVEECDESEIKTRGFLGGDAFYVKRWIRCWGIFDCQLSP